MARPAISLTDVCKSYGPNRIIHDISFDVKPGEIVGFLGPNGAGKTTTMRMIAGATTATSGTVRVSGFDMATEHDEASKKLGYLPEHPPLYDVLEVSGYLRFIANAKKVPRQTITKELDRVINACQLEQVSKTEIYKLSKGYRQRLGLAQALLGDPEVLLLDEPTAGLDPGQIQETREVIKQFGTNHAVLLSTHILTEVTLMCSRVAIINQGHLLAVDTPSSLQKASRETNRVNLLASGNINQLKAELKNLDTVHSVMSHKSQNDLINITCNVSTEDAIETEIAKIATGISKLHRIERQQPTLENVFLKYIKKGDSL